MLAHPSAAQPGAIAALRAAARALNANMEVRIAEAARARAAAQLITAAESAALHLPRLRARAQDFDTIVRDRLLAGLTVPAAWVNLAQKFRRWFQQETLKLFADVDVILAPSTPCAAPALGSTTVDIDGRAVPLRPAMGIFTQPLSLIGLPVVAVPVWLDGPLPYGVQVIAAPWQEANALRVARELERSGAAQFRCASMESGGV